MQYKIWLSFLFLLHFCLLRADPLLVAVLMVKNEESVIEMTLQPLVDAGIKDFLIYDTGSVDHTIEVTQEFFIKNNISNFVIEQGDWVDFAASRNRALQLTEAHFPDATFMLMLDAEWILHNGAQLLAYCHEQKDSFINLYAIAIKGIDVEFSHPRLIRCQSNIKFVGKVHEMPDMQPQIKLPDHVYFELATSHYGNEKSQQRWLRDRDILLQQLQENPNDVRAIYFLGQTYFWLHDLKKAIQWYEYYLANFPHGDEKFDFLFALAKAYDGIGDIKRMISTYLKAFSVCPDRAEPLIKLAQYYYNIEAYHLCYLFAKHTIAMPYPDNDFRLIEKELYDFVRYDLISATAYIVGDFSLGKQATLKALAARPDHQYLMQNLDYYESMLSCKCLK